MSEARATFTPSDAETAQAAFDRARIDTLLSDHGREQWKRRSQEHDSTPTLSDAPALGDDDLLGRTAFAGQLAQRMISMRAVDRTAPLLIHLHGAWGSGKTSLLNMMRYELRSLENPWLIVEFNAWQYQRIEPPWWSLIGVMVKQIGRQLRSAQYVLPGKTIVAHLQSTLLILRQVWFRLWSLRGGTIMAGLVAAAWGVWLLWGDVQENGDTDLAVYVRGLLPLLAGVFAAALSFFGFLFPAPEEAAQRYVGSRADPLLSLQRHISRVVASLRAPVAIFIDDLDRCDADVVVRLLEGIQTLFRDVPVTFVLAADRKWVHRAFVVAYKDFLPVVSTRARPLGYLFLEKIFQISVPVPAIDMEAKLQYWRALLRMRSPTAEREQMPDRKAREVAGIVTEDELLRYAQVNEDPLSRQAVVRRLATPELEAEITRHRLEKFGRLLEPNPRAMKRLVMAYGINRAIDILQGTFIDGDQLALWTIAAMGWPRMADWLERHPTCFRAVFEPPSIPSDDVDLDQDLLTTLKSDEFRQIVQGGGAVVGGLRADTVELLGRRGSAL